jgi:hypothetical protein
MKKGIVGLSMMVASMFGIDAFGQKPAVVVDNEPGWKKIGETSASFKMQNESISVLGADEFSAIKIKVTDAPLNIERLQVFYESGDMEEIDLKSNLNAGSESRAISLKHPDRDIQKVAFTYKTSANAQGEKADVELYGLKTNQPAGSDSYRDDKEEVERDVERAAENTESDVEQTGREVEREAEEAGDDVEREAEETANDVEREANEVSNDVDRESDEAEREVEQKAERTGNDIERSAENAGDKISEGVNDAAAAIKDDKLEDKVGPGGETAYMDDNGKYYYINNEGKKVFITKMQLKDKPDNK